MLTSELESNEGGSYVLHKPGWGARLGATFGLVEVTPYDVFSGSEEQFRKDHQELFQRYPDGQDTLPPGWWKEFLKEPRRDTRKVVR